MTCCTHDCRQGRDCPLRLGCATRRVTHDSAGLTVTEWTGLDQADDLPALPAWRWIDRLRAPALWAAFVAGSLTGAAAMVAARHFAG